MFYILFTVILKKRGAKLHFLFQLTKYLSNN